MSNDFGDDFRDDFFQNDAATAPGDKPLGLVVPPTAQQIFGQSGEIVFDGLPLQEAAYRKDGRPAVTFEEGDMVESWR
jgi:hypothetical protein